MWPHALPRRTVRTPPERRGDGTGFTSTSPLIIFPNEAAVIRLVGAVLAEMHDEWQAGDRRYLSEASMALLYPVASPVPAVRIADRLLVQ